MQRKQRAQRMDTTPLLSLRIRKHLLAFAAAMLAYFRAFVALVALAALCVRRVACAEIARGRCVRCEAR